MGYFLGWLTRAWIATLRLQLLVDPRVDLADPRTRVFCFFHGTQFPLLTWHRHRPTSVLVSHSRDGEMQAAALRVHGLGIVRGSSSRGGARGLAALVRALKRGGDAAFAVDGPRGPYGVAKAGAITAARATGAHLVPMGTAASQALILERAWDRFCLPLPFSRVVVAVGAPLEASTTVAELATAITAANDAAAQIFRPNFGDLALPPAK